MSGQFLEVAYFHTPLVVPHTRRDLFGPVDFKEWFLLQRSIDLSRVAGDILETQYRNAMKDFGSL